MNPGQPKSDIPSRGAAQNNQERKLNKMNKALGVALALSLVAGSAQAGFTIEGSPKAQEAARRSVPAKGGLVNIGTPKGHQPAVKGFAREVSLLTALKQVVPNGWRAKRAGGLDVSQLVSWKGEGRNWVEVLQTLATANGFLATLDWDRNELTVAPATMPAPIVIAEISNVSHHARPQATPVAPSAPAVKTWTLKSELTLRDNIEAWAKKEGYHVSWAAVNYPIGQPVTLAGELDAEGGPLYQLVEAYRTAEQPISVSFWSNKVIRVENTSYKQLSLSDETPNRRAMK